MVDTMDMVLDTMDMVLDTDMDTTESVMLSQRLMLIPTFCMVDTTDTVLDTMDMVLDMDMDTMESVRLNQRLTPTFCMEDMEAMDTLDTPDTMDTPMPLMAITDKLFPLVLWTANHPCFLYR